MVGWKLVSFLPSKPTPNSISGTEHDPKFPIPPDAEEAVVVAAAETLVVLDDVPVPADTVTAPEMTGAALVPVTVTVTAV